MSMAAVSFFVVGDTENKDQLKGAIEEALKSKTGTVVLSANPVIGAVLHAFFEGVVEAATGLYGNCDEMDDEEAPDAKDQESAPADNSNLACDEKCIDQEFEEENDEYEYTPLEDVITLTAAQRQLLMDKGVYFAEQVIVMMDDEELLYELGPQRLGIVTSIMLWQEKEDGVTYSAEIK